MQLQSHTGPGATSRAISIDQLVAQRAEIPKVILLVDDDDALPFLFRRVLKQLNPHPALHYLPNAVRAKDYLLGRLEFADRTAYPWPDLVLLDLRLPVFDGFEFLEWARSRTEFKALPIFVLSDSINPRDLTRADQLGATSFLVKPTEVEALIPPIKALLQL